MMVARSTSRTSSAIRPSFVLASTSEGLRAQDFLPQSGLVQYMSRDADLATDAGRNFMEATATAHRKPAAFTVRPLSPALGAEILGVDLRDPIDDALKQKFLDAWHRHLVILLRDQTLDEDSQVRFAETFGPPAKVTSGRTYSAKHSSVMLVSNIRKDGKPIGALPDGE